MGVITSEAPAVNRHGVAYRDLWEREKEIAGDCLAAYAKALACWLQARQYRLKGLHLQAKEAEEAAAELTVLVLG